MTGPRSSGLFTVPNLLSITRALLTVPFTAVMLSARPDARIWGAGIMIVAAVTDKLDGALARRYGHESDWGRILDPLADKLAAGTVAVVLLLLNEIPLWCVLAVLGRDLVIVMGGIYVKTSRRVVLPSNETGRWAMGVLAAALFALVVNAPDLVSELLLGATGIMLAISLAFYAVRFREVLRAPPASSP